MFLLLFKAASFTISIKTQTGSLNLSKMSEAPYPPSIKSSFKTRHVLIILSEVPYTVKKMSLVGQFLELYIFDNRLKALSLL